MMAMIISGSIDE